VCLDCKQGDTTHHESAVEQTGCKAQYEAVDACMAQHRGNVSDCRQEWSQFRACHEEQRRSRVAARAAAGAAAAASAHSKP
jgi:hypothetical protein